MCVFGSRCFNLTTVQIFESIFELPRETWPLSLPVRRVNSASVNNERGRKKRKVKIKGAENKTLREVPKLEKQSKKLANSKREQQAIKEQRSGRT